MLHQSRSVVVLIFCLCLILLSLLMPTQRAWACSPTSTPEGAGLPPTDIPVEIVAAQKSLVAQAIVEGKVLDFQADGPDGTVLHDVIFEVSQYDKGSGPQIIFLAGSFSLFCPMVPPFEKDDQLIILLDSQPAASGTVGVIEWYQKCNAEILASIRKAVGEKPHAPDATPVGQLPYATQPAPVTNTETQNQNVLWIIIAVLILGLIFVTLLGLDIRRRMKQLPSKSK